MLTWDILDALGRGGDLRPETAQIPITIFRASWDEVRERAMAFPRQQRAE